MKGKRRSPVRHIVRKHTRNGKTVKTHFRGSRALSWAEHRRRVRLKQKKEKKTYVPGTKIPIEWNTYKRDAQQRIYMHPLDFLALATPPKFGKTRSRPYGFSKHSLGGIEKALSAGEPFWSLRLDVDVDERAVVGHEGRHRAFWAWKKGLTSLPVVVWHERDGSVINVDKRIDVSKMKSEAKHKGSTFNAKDVAILYETLTDEERANIYGKKGRVR